MAGKQAGTEGAKRLTIALPASMKGELDKVGARIAEATEAASGVYVELTPAQIVQSLIKSALRERNGDSGPSQAA